MDRQLLGGLAAGLVLAWLLLLLALWRVRPADAGLRDAVRLLPDVLRLTTRLARDRSLPSGVRVRLWLLVGYLALPIDLVPDVIPVVGYADDAVVLVWALQAVVRRSGPEAVRRHWPGTPDGLRALEHLLGAGRRGR